MPRFRKRPVEIEAIQFDGNNIGDIWDAFGAGDIFGPGNLTEQRPFIETIEGRMHFSAGDWIIRGVAGEFYPCKPEIFVETYEPAE